MTNSAIQLYPIKSIADSSVDQALANALLTSLAVYRQPLLGRRIWLACSGGRDSLALAAICVQLFRQGILPFLPQILHVDHGLQADSSLWANHVAKWAQAQQLPCTILRVQVQGADEQAARLARYKVMSAYINQGDVLLLAHHADDQVETLLMRLIQGAGVKGLAAMQPWREQAQRDCHYVLWRPWLTITRADISHYAQNLALPYIDDPTNDNGDNVRSGLRGEVMPILAHYNSNAIENMARSAQLLSEAQAIIEERAARDLEIVVIESLALSTAQQVLAIDKLQTLSNPRQRQLIHYWLSQREPLPPSKQLNDDVYALTQRQDNDHQTQLDWHASLQNYRIYRYRQQIYRLSHNFLDWLALPISEKNYVLPVNFHNKSLTNIDIRTDSNTEYRWQLQVDSTKIDKEKWSDIVKLQETITLNVAPLNRQQKIQTTAMGRAQSGKKLYQTLEIPVWLRDSLVVITAIIDNDESLNDNEIESSKTDIPLLLLSPFASWNLTLDNSLLTTINHELFQDAINSVLQLNNDTSPTIKAN